MSVKDSGLTENITRMADDKKEIQSIPGIGESIAEKIEEAFYPL